MSAQSAKAVHQFGLRQVHVSLVLVDMLTRLQDRGALDDALWFHASGRQSAIAVKDGMVVGFLADVDSNPVSVLRSFMDGEIVIVRRYVEVAASWP